MTQYSGARFCRAVLAGVATLAMLLAVVVPASAFVEVEDYAGYAPQEKCSPRPKAGTEVLARWLVRRGGGYGPISRKCGSGGTSEHKEGRAFDWMLDATSRKDSRLAADFLEAAFATDGHGNEQAMARRMGIMYIIWNDHMYSAWDHFKRDDYLSSSCKKRSKCSKTLRHRDHMHISLSWRGARGRTSWFEGRLSAD